MKKYFKGFVAIILLVSTICMITGCGKQSPEPNNNTGENNSTKDNVEISNNETSKIENTTTLKKEKVQKDKSIELYGSKFYYPSNFEEEKVSGLTGMSIFSGNLNNGEEGYYFITLDPFYEGEFDENSVPEILNKLTMKFVNSKFQTFESKFSISTDSQSSLTLSKYQFIKKSGNIHTETNAQSSDLRYCAYYGKVDFPKYEMYNVPIMWMSFSDSNTNKTLSEIEKIVDNTANLLTFE